MKGLRGILGGSRASVASATILRTVRIDQVAESTTRYPYSGDIKKYLSITHAIHRYLEVFFRKVRYCRITTISSRNA